MRGAHPVVGTAERSVVTVRAHASRLLLPAVWLLLVSAAGGVLVGWAWDRPEWVAWLVLTAAVAASTRLCLVPLLRWWTATTEITTRRLSLRWGVLSRHGRDVPLRRVVDVALDRSLVQRLLGSGTLTLETAGDDEPLVLDGVPQPERLYGTLVTLVSPPAAADDQQTRAAGYDEHGDEYDDEYDEDDGDHDGEEGW